MLPTIDEQLVARLAHLANLEIALEERATLARELERILGYVEVLMEADTEALAPLTSVTESLEGEPLRADEPVPSLARDVALQAAPRSAEGGFVVPLFVDGG